MDSARIGLSPSRRETAKDPGGSGDEGASFQEGNMSHAMFPPQQVYIECKNGYRRALNGLGIKAYDVWYTIWGCRARK